MGKNHPIMKNLATTLLLLSFLALPFAAQAISVKKILRKHAQAMGGLEQWQQLTSYRLVFQKSEQRQLLITCRMPDQITLDFQNGGQFLRKGYDGTHGYIVKNGRYQPMRPGEEIEMAEEPVFYSDLMEAYAQNAPVKLVGEETVDGIPCYQLSWQKGPSDEQIYWVNQKTFLIEQTGEYSEDKAHAGIYYKTRLKDYHWVEGYRFPFYQLLIPSNRTPIISITSSVEVDIALPKDQFKYQPESTRNLIAYWKDRYASESLKSFTFLQETTRYRDGKAEPTTTWYEAVRYPDQFRIDFGNFEAGNINLWRQDSIYVLRKGAWAHRAPEIQASLLMKGGLYHYPVDTTLAKLTILGIDTSVFQDTTYNDRETYIIGKVANTEPQVWLDAARRTVVKRINRLNDGQLLEVRYGEFVQVNGHWVESHVAFYIEGQLIQTEVYRDIDTEPELTEDIFNPDQLQGTTWY